MRSRTRAVLRQPQNGGMPCGNTVQEELCNASPCDRDCGFGDWTSWSGCSKTCRKGHQERTRLVITPARGNGKCPAAESLERRQTKQCNTGSVCIKNNPTPKCAAKLDVVFVLDSSGSVGADGHAELKAFMTSLTKANRMPIGAGDDQSQVGVVSFADKGKMEGVDVSSNIYLSSDASKVAAAVGGLKWAKGGTNTAEGLSVAHQYFTAAGVRSDAANVVVVVTDGMPTSKLLTTTAVQRLKRDGIRIMWVNVGTATNVKVLEGWSSFPAKENVVSVLNFKDLNSNEKMTDVLANLCPQLK